MRKESTSRAFSLLFLSALFLITATIAVAQPREQMKFGKVELELLSQVNELDKKFQQEGLVYEDKQFTPYLEQLGRSLLTPDDLQLENVTWRFRVFRDPQINAFAMPSGSIYVNSGLLALLDDESQLLSILAHEIVHVRNRHTYLAYLDSRKKMVALHVVAAVEAYAGGGGIALGLGHILQLTMLGYSRKMEKEADLEGLQMMFTSQHRPSGMTEAFQHLLKDIEVPLRGEAPLLYSDHPHLKDRIAYLSEVIEQAGNKKTIAPADATAQKNRYMQMSQEIRRHNIRLAIEKGLYRTAIHTAQYAYDLHPQAEENIVSLADAYAALGARTVRPTAEELSNKGKKETRKMKSKLTLDEEDRALAATPAGKEQLQKNQAEAEKLYRQALELAPASADAYRGLGELLEKKTRLTEAIAAYRKYLDLRPDAFDRLLITRRIKTLEGKTNNQ
ncbi:MAG TPA: M48 family metalloprotease [Blastocatellia bacterium]|nr:M48 family metalloprotease [Blastocatellia bacterium]